MSPWRLKMLLDIDKDGYRVDEIVCAELLLSADGGEIRPVSVGDPAPVDLTRTKAYST